MKRLIKEQLPRKIRGLLEVVATTADESGLSAYVVGGFVRDLLIGIENLDMDIVIEGDGNLFAATLGEKLDGKVRNHAQFGTASLILPDGFKIDLATARKESYEHPGALPKVERSSIQTDLSRRDFSFNSLAVKLNGADAFSLIDFFDGQRDLEEKRVRVLHDQSFVDDPCRAFRAIRFEQRFGFALNQQTQALIKDAVKKRLVDRLSGRRLFNELTALLKERDPLPCLRRMKELGLLQFVHADLVLSNRDWEILEKVNAAFAASEKILLNEPPERWVVYLLGLLYFLEDLGPTAEHLQIPAKMRSNLDKDLQGCRKALTLLRCGEEPGPTQIYDAFAGLTAQALVLLLATTDDDHMIQVALNFFTKYRHATVPDLTGGDLVQMGLKPGPLFQDVFAALRDARLDGRVKTREDEAALVKERFLSSK